MKKALLVIVMLWSVMLVSVAQTPQTPDEICAGASNDEPETRSYSQPEEVLEAGVDYRAIFCTTSGAVYIDLYEKYAPITVNNFVFLAQSGYYNNTIFHRVIENFMAQAGDPTGTGTGGPGYQFTDEVVGFLTFDRVGLLAMANAGAGTNGSQFFITTELTNWLDYQHTIFGDVLEGYDNVVAIPPRDPQVADAPSTSLNTVVIITDLATVTSTFAEDAPFADQETFEVGLANVLSPDNLPPDLQRGASAGSFSTQEVADGAPEDVREAYFNYLTGYNHEYRVAQEVNVAECTDAYQFEQLGYVVDAFNTPEEARDALNDPFLVALNSTEGFEPVEAVNGTLAFVKPEATCSEAPGGIERLYTLRGRYLVTIYGKFGDTILSQVTSDALMLGFIAPIFERELKDAFRSELR